LCATYFAGRPEAGLSRKMLFLLATAKLNQAERFGVGLGETYGLNSDEDLPPERVYLELEEHYHTRLLAYVLDIFDLTFQVVPPPFGMRQFVKIGVFLPERLGFVFVGAAEMAGCVMFDELRRVGIELFSDEPEVRERVELLYSEILTDEVGHVGYCASRCTTAERAVMRWLYPRIEGCSLAKPLRSAFLSTQAPSHPPRPPVQRRGTHRRTEQRDLSSYTSLTVPARSTCQALTGPSAIGAQRTGALISLK
jgi:hypothetical protein